MEEKRSKFVSSALTVLSFCLLGFSASFFVSKTIESILTSVPENIRAKHIELKVAQSNGRRNINEYAFIWESGIMGKSDTTAIEEVPPEPIEDTFVPISSSFSLLGTIVGKYISLAIIKINATGEVGYYEENDTIADAQVFNIDKDRVILVRRGVKEALILFGEDGGTPYAPGRVPTSTALATTPRHRYPGTRTPIGPPGPPGPMPSVRVKRLSGSSFEVSREDFMQATQNMGMLLTQARAVPYILNGRISGFRLLSIQPGSLYDKIGLRNGDIIKSINGVPIESPDTALKIFTELRNESYFELQVVRGGKPITLTYTLR